MKLRGEFSQATFLERLNRFEIRVSVHGIEEYVYLPNPGRLRELLRRNSKLLLRASHTTGRKTRYDGFAVKHLGLWICIDSRVPNQVIHEELRRGQIPEFKRYQTIRPEYKYGESRIDFLLQDGDSCLLEVKGCTLVRRRVALFPDAPTERGTRHLSELVHAVEDGNQACIFFLVQRPDADLLRANEQTDPKFAEALRDAVNSGVQALAYTSSLDRGRIRLLRRIPVRG